MDKWVSGWVDEWLDGLVGGLVDKYFQHCILLISLLVSSCDHQLTHFNRARKYSLYLIIWSPCIYLYTCPPFWQDSERPSTKTSGTIWLNSWIFLKLIDKHLRFFLMSEAKISSNPLFTMGCNSSPNTNFSSH